MKDLHAWKASESRKPLILRGARQVGKTWILEEFGKSFSGGFVRINFDKQPEYKQFFETTKDVKRILENISLATGFKITKDSLVIFDEIQECPEALNSLKYFCEDAREYYIACAGSLLGLQLAGGFPVGKVDFLNMYPMSFEEFITACGCGSLVDYLNRYMVNEPVLDAFKNPLTEKLKMYYLIGGMPEAVAEWTENHDIAKVDYILSNILTAYRADFSKHADKSILQKIYLVWDSIPSQLSKENKKFLYSAIKTGARAREYESAIEWLKNADLVHKVYRISRPGLPLSSHSDLGAFKMYMLDTGLLRVQSNLASSVFTEEDRLFKEFKGALSENFVMQNLMMDYNNLYYWSDSMHEVDFIMQHENDIIPVEVKSGESVHSKSLGKYAKSYPEETKLCVRYSLKDCRYDGQVLNIPLYMINQTDRLIQQIYES